MEGGSFSTTSSHCLASIGSPSETAKIGEVLRGGAEGKTHRARYEIKCTKCNTDELVHLNAFFF